MQIHLTHRGSRCLLRGDHGISCIRGSMHQILRGGLEGQRMPGIAHYTKVFGLDTIGNDSARFVALPHIKQIVVQIVIAHWTGLRNLSDAASARWWGTIKQHVEDWGLMHASKVLICDLAKLVCAHYVLLAFGSLMSLFCCQYSTCCLQLGSKAENVTIVLNESLVQTGIL